MGMPDEWMMMLLTERETCHEMMDRSVEASIKCLTLLHQAVGDRCFAWGIASDDNRTQHGEFINPSLWAEMIEPHYQKLCRWIHANTHWKTFLHCCGSIYHLIPHFIEACVDILNPVQTSAAHMDPALHQAPTSGGGVRINYQYTITRTVLNHIGFGYTPSSPTWAAWPADSRKGNQILQIPGIPLDAPAFPRINFGQLYEQYGNSPYQDYYPQYFQNWAAVEDLSWVTGRHQLKFGFSFRHREITAFDADTKAGAFNFDSNSTSQPDSSNFATDGNAFASFLFGQVLSATRTIPEPVNHIHDALWAFYGEDVIKVSPKLTLTLGLRYEIPWYPEETKGIMSLFNPTLPNPGAGELPGALEFLGDGPGRTGTFNLLGTYHGTVAPRVGFAYAFDQKTVEGDHR
jgi:hypothetical protein